MNCQIIICLFLKQYLTINEFEDYFYNNMEEFQNELPDLVYEELLCTHFTNKGECINLRTFLKQYILVNNLDLYDMISDAYIEQLIKKSDGQIVHLLKEKSTPPKSIAIDCEKIKTEKEFIQYLKKELNLPISSGLNWMALNDLIYDINFPSKIEIINWNEFEERLPECAENFNKFINKVKKCIYNNTVEIKYL